MEGLSLTSMRMNGRAPYQNISFEQIPQVARQFGPLTSWPTYIPTRAPLLGRNPRPGHLKRATSQPTEVCSLLLATQPNHRQPTPPDQAAVRLVCSSMNAMNPSASTLQCAIGLGSCCNVTRTHSATSAQPKHSASSNSSTGRSA